MFSSSFGHGVRSLSPKMSSRSVPVATSAAVSATATAASPAASGTLFPGPGDVDVYCPTAQVLAIHALDGFLRLFRRAHRYESEPARPAGRPVGDEIGFQDSAEGGEGVLEVVFSDLKVEVPDE